MLAEPGIIDWILNQVQDDELLKSLGMKKVDLLADLTDISIANVSEKSIAYIDNSGIILH